MVIELLLCGNQVTLALQPDCFYSVIVLQLILENEEKSKLVQTD